MRFEKHISKFVFELQQNFGSDFFEWIEAPEGKDVNLEHISSEDMNKSLFEISVCINVRDYSEKEINELHMELNKFAKEKSVNVDLTTVDNSICIYKFSLHAKFLNVQP